MSNRIKAAIRKMALPERSVPICLESNLVAEFELAVRELGRAQQEATSSLSGGGRKVELAEKVEALRQRMLEHNAEFRFRALPKPEFRRLVREHPPRKDEETGEVVPQDRYINVNAETFFDALIHACAVDVRLPGDESGTVLDEEDWRVLLGDNDVERTRLEADDKPIEEGRLTEEQFNTLADAAWMLNKGEVDIPFSPAASQILSSSGTG